MTREDPFRDQAEKLRRRVEKINEGPNDNFSMPPRSDLHRSKKKKTKWKLKYPVIRLLVLFFILLPITIFSIYSYLEGKKVTGAKKTSVSSQGYEQINYDKPKKDKVKQVNVSMQNGDSKGQTNLKNEKTSNSSTKTGNTETGTQNNSVTSEQKHKTQQHSSNNNSTNVQDTNKNGSDPAATSSKNSNTYKIVYHTVQPNETLFHIAMIYFHSSSGVDVIKQANHIQNNDIEAGQVLKIPLKK